MINLSDYKTAPKSMKHYYNEIPVVKNEEELPHGFTGEFYIGNNKKVDEMIEYIMDDNGKVSKIKVEEDVVDGE